MLSEEMKDAIQKPGRSGILVHSKEEAQEIIALLEGSGFYHNPRYTGYQFVHNFLWDKPRRIYVRGKQIEHGYADGLHNLIAYEEVVSNANCPLNIVSLDEIL